MAAPDSIRSLVEDLRPTLTPKRPRGVFDRRDVLTAGLHAAAAYDGTIAHDHFAHVLRWRHSHATGYVYTCGAKAVVAIAGSDDWDDWRGNFRACPDPLPCWPGARVHRGLLAYAGLVVEALAPHARFLADRTVTIVGHSLGGAAAVLLPILARTDWRMPASITTAAVVTFGAPRVGNATLAKLRSELPPWQIAADGDLIPHLPLAGPLLGYRHATPLRHLTEAGHLISGTLATARRLARLTAARSLPGPLRRRIACRLRDSVVAHRMTTYLERLALPYLGETQ